LRFRRDLTVLVQPIGRVDSGFGGAARLLAIAADVVE
jgi:hypothetical protein